MSVFWYFELVGVIAAGLMFIDWCFEGYYILRAMCARNNTKKYGVGSWALVTGSTDGIGFGFAKVLARYGYNIILIARNPEKLRNAEREIKLYPVSVLSIVKDFSECPENPSEFFNDIEKQTNDLDISIVINNIGTSIPGYFHELLDKDILNQNALNLWPVVYLSKIYLKRMLSRPQPSAFINLSSTGSLVPLSGLSVYCAAKAFTDLFTLDLIEEVRYQVKHEKLQNIDILSLQPAFVDTLMTKDLTSKPLIISPEVCAENALRVLGKVNYSSCHWKHFIFAAIYRNLPWYINAKVTLYAILQHNKYLLRE